MKGNVYVLSNKSLPEVYKIGITTRSPYERASELSTTGVPTSFEVEYYILVEDYDIIEKIIHRKLALESAGKEFFRCKLEKCISAVRVECDKHYIYDEKFKDNVVKNSVLEYEFFNDIKIDKNLKEHNIKVQNRIRKENEERRRLQREKEEREAAERIKREEEYRIHQEKLEKERFKNEIKKKEKEKQKKEKGIAILIASFFICMLFPHGFGMWIAFAVLWSMWFFFGDI